LATSARLRRPESYGFDGIRKSIFDYQNTTKNKKLTYHTIMLPHEYALVNQLWQFAILK
jgi:hypothetical protein